MKFGVREICNVVFKAKSKVKIGNTTFNPGQPVLYIDTAKTSTIEGAATTVYATGGRGNVNLVAWEGEKTLTFTVEDALLSPIGFAILSGAGLLKGSEEEKVHVHITANTYCDEDGKVDLSGVISESEEICTTAPIFVMTVDKGGSFEEFADDCKATKSSITSAEKAKGKNVFVDFYITKSSAVVDELQIDAENFAGYYYVEADTLFRRQDNGKDLPANITFPNVKIQSNFTFSMASTGDPSTFTFTMDAFPGTTYFNPNRKVLCVIQVIDDEKATGAELQSVMKHKDDEDIAEANGKNDSYDELGE